MLERSSRVLINIEDSDNDNLSQNEIYNQFIIKLNLTDFNQYCFFYLNLNG